MADSPGPDTKSDYTFGQIAIRENICSFQQVKECLDIQGKLRTIGIEPKKLGDILIEKGYLTAEQAVQVAKLQVQAASSKRVSIPGYELISKIGEGAMGAVYKARQISMDRIVAIKVLAPKYSKDRSFVDRFLREARAVARLNHENIISGIDVGEAGGIHFFVMEFVDGAPVTSLMRKGRLEERRCLEIALQIAKALSHAHRHGIVHRDVKPENIMITGDGLAKLCDLGLAKQIKGDAAATMDGMSVGTPNYISPEQARGEEKIDIRSDIYSLGASLYHMATGQTPFSGANPMVVMTKHVTEYPESPKKHVPGLSEGFCSLVLKMMGKRREERPQEPEALISEVERVLRGIESAPAPAPGTRRTVRPAADLPKPKTDVPPKAKTDPGVLPPVHHHHALRPRASSSTVPALLGIGGVVTVGVLAFLFFFTGGPSDDGSSSAVRPPPVEPPRNPPPPPTPAGSADKVKEDLEAFRRLIHPRITESRPDRFTDGYSRILQQLDRYRKQGDFAAEKLWEDERVDYMKRVNDLVGRNVWADIKKKATEHLGGDNYTKALEELNRFEDVYRWFSREPKPERTQAGREYEKMVSDVTTQLNVSFVTQKRDVDQLFRDPKRRDEAYRMLDTLYTTGTAEQKQQIDNDRLAYLKRDLDEVLAAGAPPESHKKAQDRIQELKKIHSNSGRAVAYLDQKGEEVRRLQQEALTGALAQATLLYANEFAPKFTDAMQRRDLPAARRHLHGLVFGKDAATQEVFLAGFPDAALLRAYLDPQRAAAADVRRVAALAEEGFAAARKAGRVDALRDLLFDLRTTALLDELMEQALEGAKLANRDPARFKGYSPVLRDSVSVEPAPRRPDGLAVSVTGKQGAGTVTQPASLTPRGGTALTEEDLLALAKRFHADKDPHVVLRAFFLNYYAGRLPAAKACWEKMATPEVKAGLEKFTEKLATTTSEREEKEAEALWREASDLYVKKRDELAAARKFKDCLDRFANTEWMKFRVPTLGKTRIEIAEDKTRVLGGPPTKGSGSGKGLFGTPDWRDLGRSRYDVIYAFKDDKELGAFSAAPSVPGAPLPVERLAAGGVRISGTGVWFWNAPLRGNVVLEVNFKMETESPIGFIVHGEGQRSGYLSLVDLELPGVGAMDAIFRQPINWGPQIMSSVLSNAGRGLDVTKDGVYQARLERTGTKIRFQLGQGNMEADHADFNQGRVGVVLGQTTVVIERLRVVGEVDKAWVDAESK